MNNGARALALLALALLGSGCDSEREAPKNLVLVVVDTLRADHMSLYGYERPTTPRLDAFAAERAVVFEGARSTASWTKPSVASIFTGLDPRQHRVTKHMDGLHSSLRTLAQTFGEAGYRTHGIQSNLYLLSAFGFDKGFIGYEDSLITSEEDGTVATYNRSTGAEVNRHALEWLDARDASSPFFLYVHHYEPHHAYLAEEPSFMPAPEVAPEPERRRLLGEVSMDDLFGGVDQLTREDVAYLAARYDSEILLQDRLLGELIDGLGGRGLLESSVVVFTADHGEEFLEHGGISHANDKLYDELLHVPLVIAAPGLSSARRSGAVSLIDLGRTALDLCGLEASPFPGRSFAAALGGAPAFVPGAVVSHGTLPVGSFGSERETELESLVEGHWKLIRDAVTGELQLFDLAADPHEQHDLAEAEPERARALEAKLARFLEQRGGVGDELPDESADFLRRQQELIEEYKLALESLGYTGQEEPLEHEPEAQPADDEPETPPTDEAGE